MSNPKIRDEFFIIENFINKETCEAVIKYFDYLVENKVLKWNEISFYGSQAMGYWPTDDRLKLFGLDADFFGQLKEKIKSKTEELLGFEVNEVSYHAQKWIEGAYAGYHSDNTPLESPEYNSFERSKWAAFLYLNEDFEGGELYFSQYDVTFKPKAGMMIYFPAGANYQHRVNYVTSGTRYATTTFWKVEKWNGIQYS